MLYHAYEFAHAAIAPWRAAARLSRQALSAPLNPCAASFPARAGAAALQVFVNATARYGKPEFGLTSTRLDGMEGDQTAPIIQRTVASTPFCDLVHFQRDHPAAEARRDPPLLIAAPLSGHFATLLRGTVEALAPHHDVYITDWRDARNVPVAAGAFDMDDCTETLMAFCRMIASDADGDVTRERPALLAVSQAGVPALAAAAMMAEDDDPARPASLVLMGSPIDVARNPRAATGLIASHSASWFERNAIVTVPWPNPGFLRRVYPGFLQLSGFMQMNLDRHVDAHMDHFRHLIRGDGDGDAAHRSFYDEFLAVMDLTAEFYLQTLDRVFRRRLLARGLYRHRETRPVRPEAIRDIALMTLEGGRDDITGPGQTRAAHDLCAALPDAMRAHLTVEEVGHYGLFNGARWRTGTAPRVRDFIHAQRIPARGRAPADAGTETGADAGAETGADAGTETGAGAAAG